MWIPAQTRPAPRRRQRRCWTRFLLDQHRNKLQQDVSLTRVKRHELPGHCSHLCSCINAAAATFPSLVCNNNTAEHQRLMADKKNVQRQTCLSSSHLCVEMWVEKLMLHREGELHLTNTHTHRSYQMHSELQKVLPGPVKPSIIIKPKIREKGLKMWWINFTDLCLITLKSEANSKWGDCSRPISAHTKTLVSVCFSVTKRRGSCLEVSGGDVSPSQSPWKHPCLLFLPV